MPAIAVILVEPKYEGNIGFIARGMKNFGLKKLILVNPPKLGPESYQRAMHGADVLENCKIVSSFADALKTVDLAIATSAVPGREKKILRVPLSPSEMVARIRKLRGTAGIVFGREDIGLLNEELKLCDIFVTIPASEAYPVLNLSHAAIILFYELYKAQLSATIKRVEASKLQKEKLFELFALLLEQIDYPLHRRAKTELMFRRLLGRTGLSEQEFHTLMGVFRRTTSL